MVFATAFDQYAVKAFEVNAVDYLLKPFDKKRVAQVDQTRAPKLEPLPDPATGSTLWSECWSSSNGRRPAAKILIKSAGRLFLVDQKDICYASIEDGVITVVPLAAWKASRTAALWKNCWPVSTQTVLARAPFLPGEHQSHQGSRAVVQELLPASHGRQEADRDSGEPRPDQAAAGIVQAVEDLPSLSFCVRPLPATTPACLPSLRRSGTCRSEFPVPRIRARSCR